MHEFSIASSIVETLLEFTRKERASAVLSVQLAVGELTQVEAEQLTFCYDAIIKETPLEGSTLEIERIKAVVRCSGCSYAGPPQYWDAALCFVAVPTLKCPLCGETVNIIGGEECSIRKVKFIR